MNQFEIDTVRGDQAGSVGAGGESDENIEMKVAQFGRCEAVIGTDAGEYLTRFLPILLRWSQNWVVSCEGDKKLAI